MVLFYVGMFTWILDCYNGNIYRSKMMIIKHDRFSIAIFSKYLFREIRKYVIRPTVIGDNHFNLKDSGVQILLSMSVYF